MGGLAAAVATVLISGAAPALASEVERGHQGQPAGGTPDQEAHAGVARTFPGPPTSGQARTSEQNDRRPGLQTLTVLRHIRRENRRYTAWTGERLATLSARHDDLQAWLYSWGIFRVCPVDQPHYIHNDFGEIVNVEGVEPHVHMGSDIEAPSWTPIRAPFDGYASSSYSPLGGYQVYVRGDRGYVFNAHLIAYGDLGWVGAGTVIGYVGATGDSTASHDHFEWHPWHGRAVDPYYLLSLACD